MKYIYIYIYIYIYNLTVESMTNKKKIKLLKHEE